MKVSVVVATKNAEKYIIEQLSSIQRQTFTDFECIVVDDHSTDSTPYVVSSLFCSKDARFKLYNNVSDMTTPFADAHNKLYELASGEYIVHVDQDDVCVSNMLDKFVAYMDSHPDIDIVCGRIGVLTFDDANGIWVKKKIVYDRELSDEEKQYLHNPSKNEDEQFIKSPAKSYGVLCNLFTHQCFCGRSHVLKEFQNKGVKYIWNTGCEYVFIQRLIAGGCRVSKIQDVLLYWRDNSKSLSHNWDYGDPLIQYQASYARLLMLMNNKDEEDVSIFTNVYRDTQNGIVVMKNSCEYFYDILVRNGREHEIPKEFQNYSIFQ